MKTVKNIWHWEWRHERRQLMVRLVPEAAILLAVLLFYKLKKGLLFAGVAAIKRLPLQLYVFLGIGEGTQTGNLNFFLLYALMLINGWNVWRYCCSMIHIMDRDTLSGSIFLICNQWLDKERAALGKWGWNVLSFAAGQSALYLWALLLALAGSTNHVQRMGACAALASLWCKSIFVLMFLSSLTFLYAAAPKHDIHRRSSGFVGMLFWMPFVCGNLYKLRDVAFSLLEILGINGAGVARKLEWLKGLYWLSPLSWMNPFTETGAAGYFLQLVLCAVAAALAVGMGVWRYRKREICM